MDVSFQSATEHSLAALAGIMTRSYSGYVVPIRFDAATFAARVRAEHIDLPSSAVIRSADGIEGLVLIARRGRRSRTAAVGIMEGSRGRGIGRKAMDWAIAAARGRGDDSVGLEVITSNAPAVALYRSLGFKERRSLAGYRHPGAGDADPPLPSSLEDAVRFVLRHGDDDQPWQVDPVTLAGATPPLSGYLIGERAAAIVEGRGAEMRLVSFAVARDARRQGIGRQALALLMRQFQGRAFVVPAIVAEEREGAFLAACGWEKTPIAQFDMSLAL